MTTFTETYQNMTAAEKRDACVRLDVSLATLSRWASGERRPTIDTAVRIEKVLHVKLASWAQVVNV